MNRIENWWKDMLKWKERFEDLFKKMGIRPDRAFKSEELHKYEQFLRKMPKDLNEEERLTKKIVTAEYLNLYRTLYPNLLYRLSRKIMRKGSAIVNNIFSELVPDRTAVKNRELLDKFKLSEMSQHQKSNFFKPVHSESQVIDEILDYRLKLTLSPNGKPIIEGFEVQLKKTGKTKETVFIDESMSIDKFQAADLLRGRAIYLNGNKWIVPDNNDRDAEGHIKLREITISDFDIKKELSGISAIKLKDAELEELSSNLKNGKRQDILIKSEGGTIKLGVEVNPLKRSLVLYDEGNKRIVPIQQLTGNNSKNRSNVLKMDPTNNKPSSLKL